MKKRAIKFLLIIQAPFITFGCGFNPSVHEIDTSIIKQISKDELVDAINNSNNLRYSCRSYSNVSEEHYYPHKISNNSLLQYQTYKNNGLSISKYGDFPEMYTTAHFTYKTGYISLNNDFRSYENGYDKEELRFIDQNKVKIITTLVTNKTITAQYGTKYICFTDNFIEHNFTIGTYVDTQNIFLGVTQYGLNSKNQIVVKQTYNEFVKMEISEIDETIKCRLYYKNLYILVRNEDGWYIRNVEIEKRYCLKNETGNFSNSDATLLYSTFNKLGFFYGWLGYFNRDLIPNIKEEDYFIGMGLL